MKTRLGTTILFFAVSLGAANAEEGGHTVASPDGRLQVVISLGDGGAPQYAVKLGEKSVLRPSKLGLIREDADFSQSLKLAKISEVRQVREEYEILTAKRRHNHYVANERIFHFLNQDDQPIDIEFRVSDDGLAFRYRFPNQSSTLHKIDAEATSFHFPSEAKAWLQPMSVAKTGWEKSNPSYEEHYQQGISVDTPSPTGAGWVFPALYRIDDGKDGGAWALLSETGLGRSYCGCRLASNSPDGEYRIAFPDPREVFPGGPVNPESTLPWATPWRILVVGDLATVTESMLGVHLATPAAVEVAAEGLPGKSSWSWVLLKDDNTIFPVQKRFIDYSAQMGWKYCLVDCDWDKRIGEEKLAELVAYGRERGVELIVWYNSAGSWNSTPYTPRGKLVTHEARVKEFEKLNRLGVAGLKIDFFGGDGQSMIAYYHDLLTDAASYGFAINFHGATLPRGWHRTYPHLMTVEAIRGMEFITFGQGDADLAPSHNAMLPFTRNVFDPMDYTPMALHEIPNIERRTSAAHELATAVLFTSGIQHYAETPTGMTHIPDYVQDCVRQIPNTWDDIKLLDGQPGKFVVLARRQGDTWWIAGVNGENSSREVSLDLKQLKGLDSRTEPFVLQVISDGPEGPNSFQREEVRMQDAPWRLTLKPHGGFVATQSVSRVATAQDAGPTD